MDSLKRAMKWDEEAYGREYDLDIFMIVAVSAFNIGAMENKGLNIFNDKLLLASPETATDDDYARIESVVAHEYFHNWTGDRITCRDWFQLSLKEGLTVFRDQSFSADMRSHGVQRIEDVRALRARQFAEDAGPLAHPVQPQSYIKIDNFYTATVYEKGAEVIGMLKTLVGDEGYRKATDLYFERHDGQAATVEDWVKCFEDACGRDLDAVPPVVPPGRHAGDRGAAATMTRRRKTYALTLTQSLAPTPGQPDKKPMHIPVRLGLVGAKRRALPLTLEGENARRARRARAGTDRGRSSASSSSMWRKSRCCRWAAASPRPPSSSSRSDRHDARHADGPRRRCLQPLGSGPGPGRRDPAGNGGARPRGRRRCAIYIDAIGDVLARAEEDPAFAAQMLMPPTESELALAMTPVDPDAHPRARASALIRAVAAAHGAALGAALRAYARCEGAFSPGRRVGRPARPAQRLPALSDRRGRRSRGGPGRCALSHRHQHDRHDRGPGGADPHGIAAARRRLRPFPRPLPARSAGAGQMDEPAGRLAAARTPSRRCAR